MNKKANNSDIVLAIVTGKPYEECETFIKAQIDSLPFTISHFILGDKFLLTRNGVKRNLLERFFEYKILLFEKVKNRSDIKSRSALQKYLFKREKVSVILAQYGIIGAEIIHISKISKFRSESVNIDSMHLINW